MSFVYTPAKAKLLSGGINLNVDDIRLLLVMSNTTCDTEEDTEFIALFTTLDECNGANYVRKALAGEIVTADLVNNRGKFSADPVTWAALGVGTRQNVAIVLYKHVGTDTVNLPIAYIDQPVGTNGFPFDGNGGDVVYTPNVEGIFYN